MPFSVGDTVISPIINAIGAAVQAQIPNTVTFYPLPPEGAPDDDSCLVLFTGFTILDETNGKLDLQLNFNLLHIVRKSVFSDNLANLYSLFFPYIQVLSSWPTQNLSGLSRTVTPKRGRIAQLPFADEPHVALVIEFEVQTQYNISLS